MGFDAAAVQLLNQLIPVICRVFWGSGLAGFCVGLGGG